MSQGVRKTHQHRSRQTRDKLLNALEKLLRQKDFADIGVAEIAKEAGVSPASIYRRFDKKDGFIAVLFDLYLERLGEWVSSPEAQLNLEGCDLRQALHKVAAGAWIQLQQQTHLLKAIYLNGRKHLDLLGEKGDVFEAGMLMAMQGIIALYADDVKRTDRDKSARMLAYYFNNILIERGLFKKQTSTWADPLSDEEFTAEIAEFAYGYLIVADA